MPTASDVLKNNNLLKYFLKYGAWLLLLPGTLFYFNSAISVEKSQKISIAEEALAWEATLNALNFNVIRISAANLIKGLNLTQEQLQRLYELQKITDTLYVPPAATAIMLLPLTDSISDVYNQLYEAIVQQKSISDSLKTQVFDMRLKHSMLINQTLHAKTRRTQTPLGCISCHGLPRHFPELPPELLKNRKVYAIKRYRIDKAHAVGMLGKACNLKIWYFKDNVDLILNNAQRCMAGEFTCCLIPPSALADPERAGQAFSTDDWVNYFREVRKHDNKTWRRYKHLYIKPLEPVIIATLPGITEFRKNLALFRMEKVLEKIRALDDIDFELQKEVWVSHMEACYNFDDITGVSHRSSTIKKYVTAMFLLFPGNGALYEGLLK